MPGALPNTEVEVMSSPKKSIAFQATEKTKSNIFRAYYGTMLDDPIKALDAFHEAANDLIDESSGLIVSDWMLQQAGYKDRKSFLNEVRKAKVKDQLFFTGRDFLEAFGVNAASCVTLIEPPKGTPILDAHTLGPITNIGDFEQQLVVLGPSHPFVKEYLRNIDLSQYELFDLQEYVVDKIPDLALLSQLGEGHFSQAWRSTSTKEGLNDLVVQGPKRKKDQSLVAQQYTRAKKNISELHSLGATKIVEPIDQLKTPDDIMVTKFIKGGDLEARIKSLRPDDRLRTCYSCLDTLVLDVHAKGFTHGDIKAENFFGEDEFLGDFTEAKKIGPKGAEGLEAVIKSPEGMADWQNMGQVLYQILSGGKMLPKDVREIPNEIKKNFKEILAQFPQEKDESAELVLKAASELAQGKLFPLPSLLEHFKIEISSAELEAIKNTTLIDMARLKQDLDLLDHYKDIKYRGSTKKMRDRFITPSLDLLDALLELDEVNQGDIAILSSYQAAAFDSIEPMLKKVFRGKKFDPKLIKVIYDIRTDEMTNGLKELLDIVFQYKYSEHGLNPSERKLKATKTIQAIKEGIK